MTIPWGADDVPEELWDQDEFADVVEPPATDLAGGLVSLGFIRAALRRSARFWCAAAVAGLLLGFGAYVEFPPAYEASTSLLLTHNPDDDPLDAMQTDAAMAQSQAVAGLAMQKLGLRESLSSFAAAYTVTVVTDRVLLITVSAPTSNEAVARAKTLATEFLQFRAAELKTEEQLTLAALDQQITAAEQQVKSVSRQISQVSAQPASPARQAKLSDLMSERGQERDSLAVLEQATTSSQASTQLITASMVQGSQVLDPAAPVHHSRRKLLILYVGAGLIAGLVLGMGVVVVRALVSDRLRRRDDVAHALGAPVKLSVGTVRVSRWQPGRRGLAAARGRDLQRIVAHLRNTVPGGSHGAAALAVVPVDNAQVAALSLVSLAVSCAQENKQVVVADLCSGAPAARLLGASGPGVRAVRVNGAHLVVAVPDRDDVVPVGPLRRASPQAEPASDSQALADAYAAADVLLSLVTLDPSLGGEHLATWATGVVAVVTAGRSSATRIHAVGEMIRLAGTPLVSAVLVGADKTDESLGVAYTPDPPAPAGPRLGVIGL